MVRIRTASSTSRKSQQRLEVRPPLSLRVSLPVPPNDLGWCAENDNCRSEGGRRRYIAVMESSGEKPDLRMSAVVPPPVRFGPRWQQRNDDGALLHRLPGLADPLRQL